MAASPVQNAFYGLLVLLGIAGNGLVILCLGSEAIKPHRTIGPSDLILLNVATSNMLVSVFRNILLFQSDLGKEVYISAGWCQFFMCIWVWLRSANVWVTFCLSTFHLITIRQRSHAPRGLHVLGLALALIWTLSLIYAVPAYIFSTRGDKNSTEGIMIISSTTRPLLGCVWNFPSQYSGLVYATSSLVLHEAIPILLMLGTNLATLNTLRNHGKSVGTGTECLRGRVPAERKAAKLILSLIILFVVSWGASVLSVNYYNYNRGPSSEYMLIVARFSNSLFIGLSPLVLAAGHRKLQNKLKNILSLKRSFFNN
ncbi:olfactory receptor class A-like protein 4 [Erpetoichthys calabaricus]|uniref:olfactory receptor class A-like protein 4 n=1 Tax=Erpetoichthys calabaricus TaxID=27687 RepID=UPI0010A06614|nr:olfactory receptor class A-like protein 4 [Erpetoichthys calabaricus]